MRKVVRTPGCILLYTGNFLPNLINFDNFFAIFDTDSLLYARLLNADPLKSDIGSNLGDLSSEYPHHTIVEAVFGGAKQYGLKLVRHGAAENEFEYVLKIRGMTLNWDVLHNQGLHYETFKKQVLEFAQTGQTTPIEILYPNQLCPSVKLGAVISEKRQKTYHPFCGKGVICSKDFCILHFGYVS